jgi:hypothetical protein
MSESLPGEITRGAFDINARVILLQRNASSQGLSCRAKRRGQLYVVSQRVHRLPGA